MNLKTLKASNHFKLILMLSCALFYFNSLAFSASHSLTCSESGSITSTEDQCQAIFYYSQVADDSLKFKFIDESHFVTSQSPNDSIVGWLWNFGDGTTSNSKETIHEYSAEGEYVVSLKIFKEKGCQATTSYPITVKYKTITPPTNCDALYSYSQVAPDSLKFKFVDESALVNNTANNDTIVTWLWDFGDGNTSTLEQPTHEYAQEGEYQVAVTITKEKGCQASRSNLIVVKYQTTSPPQNDDCKALYHFTKVAPDSLKFKFFDDSEQVNNTMDNDTIVSWLWDFGDGNTSTLEAPEHEYAIEGNYEVSLTITKEKGCQATVTNLVIAKKIITIPTACQAYFEIEKSMDNPLTVKFNDLSIISNDTYQEHLWDFGDGNTSSEKNPTHTYTEKGEYNVTLTIKTIAGCESTVDLPIEVDLPNITPDDCNALFSYNVITDDELIVKFNDQSTSFNNDNITSWEWNFGDGNNSDEAEPNHTYSDEGVYNVSLTIETTNGCQATATKSIEVKIEVPGNPNECEALFSFEQISNDELKIKFTDESPLLNDSITSQLWNFGNGVISSFKNPTHEYASEGTYHVTLTITTLEGCMASITNSIEVKKKVINTPTDCEALFSYDQVANDELKIEFIDESPLVNDSITSRFWNFGDGNFSALEKPTHEYANEGTYNVTLKITTLEGCETSITNSIEVELNVANPPTDCEALFYYQQLSAAELKIEFRDESELLNDSIVTRLWDFGDGNSSTEKKPVHTYDAEGEYEVFLTITNSEGCQATYGYPIDFSISSNNTRSQSINNDIATGKIGNISRSIAETSIQTTPLMTDVKLYPNPVNQILNVEMMSQEETNLNVQIQTMTGKNISTTVKSLSQGKNNFQLNVSQLQPGMYIVRLQNGTEGRTIKFLK